MTDRIIDIADTPARLSQQGELLVIEPNGHEKVTVPFGELAAVIASHPQVVVTQGALSSMSKSGTVYICCDDKHMPAGMLLPLSGHFVQGERFEKQMEVSLPTKKRLWQSIVFSKILNQSTVLRKLGRNNAGIKELANKVRSGDPENIEAQAAQRYWLSLFADSQFRRDPNRDDQNRLLNYGYAILRAVVSRAVCGAGLHPSLSWHHHNRYDTFRLASDLMEPLRPLIDFRVAEIIQLKGVNVPLDKTVKEMLISAMNQKVNVENELRTVFDACLRLAQSFAAVIECQRENLALPEIVD